MLTSFTTFSEAPPQTEPRTHLSHLEDLVFDGPQGVKFVNDVLTEFAKILDGDISEALNVSVKWDGSPAIIFGPDPADKRFFVGTKSVFNKLSPRLAKSHAAISAMYVNPVAAILHLALDELPKLMPDRVMQGDLLFSRAVPDDSKGAVRPQVIDGHAYLTFQPNTILYAVDGESALGLAVHVAKMGIALHTAYSGTGTTVAGLRAKNMSPMTYAGLKKDPAILTLDAHFDDVSGTVTFTAAERADFVLAHVAVGEAFEALNMSVYDVLHNWPKIRENLSLFVNDRVRQGKSDPVTQEDFIEFQDRVIGSDLKRDAAILLAGFDELFQLHNAVVRAKTIILRKLQQAATVATFLPTKYGFRATNVEGFVAVAHTGQAVKLVDRLEFSRANFENNSS